MVFTTLLLCRLIKMKKRIEKKDSKLVEEKQRRWDVVTKEVAKRKPIKKTVAELYSL